MRGGGRARHVGGGERPQRQQPAAGADGRQHARGRMAHQQQHGAPGRLFQDLEQRVRARWVELVDRIDDGDPPAALPGGRAEERDRPAHVVDLDVLAQLAGFFVDRALQHQQIALRLRRDAPRHRMIGVDVQRFRGLHRRRARIGMGEHEARHAVGERRLADAGRTRDQPGMREASAAIGVEQRAAPPRRGRRGPSVSRGGGGSTPRRRRRRRSRRRARGHGRRASRDRAARSRFSRCARRPRLSARWHRSTTQRPGSSRAS